MRKLSDVKAYYGRALKGLMTVDGGTASGEASYSGFGCHASASFYASHNDSKVSSDVSTAGGCQATMSCIAGLPVSLQMCKAAQFLGCFRNHVSAKAAFPMLSEDGPLQYRKRQSTNTINSRL